MKELQTEILVVGGGPAGYVAAIRAGQLKKKVILVEKERVGGMCLNHGCIPSKTLLFAAEILSLIKKGEKYGIKTGSLSVDINQLRQKKRSVVEQLVKGVEYLIKHSGGTIINGKAKMLEPKSVLVNGPEEVKITAQKVLIATGSYPVLLPGFEVDGKTVVTSREALEIPFVPKNLAVIGGGYVGMEMAVVYHSLGSQITVIEKLDKILLASDRQIAEVAIQKFKKMGMKIYTNTQVSRVEKINAHQIQLTISNSGKEERMVFDMVLLAVGHKPQLEGLEGLNLTKDSKGFIKVNSKMQTSSPDVFAIGDVTGGKLLAHKAFKEGEVAVEVASGLDSEMNYLAVPYAIFTQPELAGVGLTDSEATEQGYKVKTAVYPFRASGRALSMEESEGLVKMVADAESDVILGMHIVGPYASEMIAEASLAISMGAVCEDMSGTIHVHPTLSETMMEVAALANKRAIHMANP